MQEVEQTRFGGPYDPPEQAGNCFAACLATILELGIDEVPDEAFISENGEAWDQWLRDRNLAMAVLRHDWQEYRLDGYLIAGCESAFYKSEVEGAGAHVVVVHDGEVVWNPNPRDKRSLQQVAQTLDGWTYIVYPRDFGRVIGKDA